jgi:ABC-type amino acid transport substrate-binding protein
VAFCQIQLKEFALADVRLRSIEAASAGKFDSSTPEEFHAQLDLMRAAVAAAAGDIAQAGMLLTLPRRIFVRPDTDPYMFRWTQRLASSLNLPGPSH